MSLPQELTKGISAAESAFIAESTIVEIVPRRRLDRISLIGSTTNEFQIRKRNKVPLWLAILLRNHGRCNVVCPNWLYQSYLEKILEQEIKDINVFTNKLPLRYYEISHELLSCTGIRQDFAAAGQNPSIIRQLLRDINDARNVKVRRGLDSIVGEFIQMDGVSSLEIATIRPLVRAAIDFSTKVANVVPEEM